MFLSRAKSGIRPIEIGRKLIRAIDTGRSTGADGRTIAPNLFVVHLNEIDRGKFGDLEKALLAELTDAAVQYTQDEGFVLPGDVAVSIITDAAMKAGKCEVRSSISTAQPEVAVVPSSAPVVPVTPPTIATPSIPPVPTPQISAPSAEKKAFLVLGDGAKVAVKPGVLSVGRSAESSVPLNDTNVSRRHAEIRSRGEGPRLEWFLVDLGSTNGTMVNGVKVTGEQRLRNGDALMFGNTAARFEVS